MTGVNKAIILGNLGRDPEIRSVGSGRVANLTIATSESWRDKTSGERKEKTEWHRVTIWTDGLIGVVEKYLKKGSKVYIEGQIQTRKYEKDGKDHYATEIVLQGFNAVLVMLDGKDGGSAASEPERQSSAPAGRPGANRPIDDDVPF